MGFQFFWSSIDSIPDYNPPSVVSPLRPRFRSSVRGPVSPSRVRILRSWSHHSVQGFDPPSVVPSLRLRVRILRPWSHHSVQGSDPPSVIHNSVQDSDPPSEVPILRSWSYNSVQGTDSSVRGPATPCGAQSLDPKFHHSVRAPPFSRVSITLSSFAIRSRLHNSIRAISSVRGTTIPSEVPPSVVVLFHLKLHKTIRLEFSYSDRSPTFHSGSHAFVRRSTTLSVRNLLKVPPLSPIESPTVQRRCCLGMTNIKARTSVSYSTSHIPGLACIA
ncbi:hypothetical protein BV898_08134 [Hypsibius exemplaris]|uniref:Uncharacterized protein n=1 Tax=Hypsibius exemplaris TaxID=2072580 RepID=A0A1W0WRM8_HYPEX|nr:hypothetical protein BV898_08134 [Hypsibius exemplaris]